MGRSKAGQVSCGGGDDEEQEELVLLRTSQGRVRDWLCLFGFRRKSSSSFAVEL